MRSSWPSYFPSWPHSGGRARHCVCPSNPGFEAQAPGCLCLGLVRALQQLSPQQLGPRAGSNAVCRSQETLLLRAAPRMAQRVLLAAKDRLPCLGAPEAPPARLSDFGPLSPGRSSFWLQCPHGSLPVHSEMPRPRLRVGNLFLT